MEKEMEKELDGIEKGVWHGLEKRNATIYAIQQIIEKTDADTRELTAIILDIEKRLLKLEGVKHEK